MQVDTASVATDPNIAGSRFPGGKKSIRSHARLRQQAHRRHLTTQFHLRWEAAKRQEEGHRGVPEDRRHQTERARELAGDDDGHSEREVGSEVDAGDDARPLMCRREREDEPQGCGEGRTEADTGDGPAR